MLLMGERKTATDMSAAIRVEAKSSTVLHTFKLCVFIQVYLKDSLQLNHLCGSEIQSFLSSIQVHRS